MRGDTSLTYVDVESRGADEPPRLKCVGLPTAPEAPGGFITCDDDHRIITAKSGLAAVSRDSMPDPMPPDIPLPDEPYALAVDAHDGLLFIGHLSGNTTRPYTGGFSLFDIAPPANMGNAPSGAPRFIAPFPSPFSANSVGSVGVTALNAKDDGTVYASSRYTPQVAGLGTTAQCPVDGSPVRETRRTRTASTTTRRSRAPRHAGSSSWTEPRVVLQRSPPALVRFLPPDSPLYPGTPTDILETCSSPTFLDKYDSGVGERLFVTCFADGEIYVYDRRCRGW